MPLPSTFLNYMEEDEGMNPKHPENVQNLEEKVSNQGLLYNQNDLVYCLTLSIIITHIMLHYATLDRNMTRVVSI